MNPPAPSGSAWRLWRRVVSRWRRTLRWEFWPAWALYPPVVLWILWLALRHGGLTVFTVVNPRIWTGGVIGASKQRILSALRARRDLVARSALLAPAGAAGDRIDQLRSLMRQLDLDWPIVLKPDIGARGAGVRIVQDEAQALGVLADQPSPLILQEYVPGREFGVFYARHPSEERGRIISITDKRLAEVQGDGRRCLRDLILADPRAVALAETYCENRRERLDEVPAEGDVVRLGELGTHCRGAIFLDGARLHTPRLEAAIDELSRGAEGFFFGRFDLRVGSEEELREGRGFKVVELNGVFSESAHIYDPRYSVFAAWRTLIGQWSLAAEIGSANRARGHRVTPLRELLAAARRLGSAAKAPLANPAPTPDPPA